MKGEALLSVTPLFLSSTIPALKRLSLGLVYLVGYTLLSPHITEDYLVTDDYDVSACQPRSDCCLTQRDEQGPCR